MQRLLGFILGKKHKKKSQETPSLYSKEYQLKLEPLSEKDIELISYWFKDPDTCRLAFGVDTDWQTLLTMATEYIEEMRADNTGVLMITSLDHAHQSPQGFLRYKVFAKHPNNLGRIGILIGEPQARGQGLGQKAIKILLAHLFGNHLADTVELDTAHFNEAAQRCFTKCGFKKTREAEIIGIHSDWVERRVIMQITSQDWILKNLDGK